MSRERHSKWSSIIETRHQKGKREREEQYANAAPVQPELAQPTPPALEIVSPSSLPLYSPLPDEFQFNSPWAKSPTQEEPQTPISGKRAKAKTPTTVGLVVEQGIFSAPSPKAPPASPQRGFSSGDSSLISPGKNLIPLLEARDLYAKIASEVEEFLQNGIKDQDTLKAFITQKTQQLSHLQDSMVKNPKIRAACQKLILRLTTHLMEAHAVDQAHEIQEFKTPLRVSGRK